MTHYHEVYFNEHTNDGPRVGMTRRRRMDIVRERAAARRNDRYVHPGAKIVRCERPDSQCPWTMDGVPGEQAWIVEVHDEDGDVVELIAIKAADREHAVERAWPRIEELRAEHEDDNLLAGRVYLDGVADHNE